MKNNIKPLIAGILIGITAMTGTFVLADTQQKIDAYFGRIKLIVEGTPAKTETLLYNGTTYVPIREASEILGKTVSFDENTKTAYLGAKIVTAPPSDVEENTDDDDTKDNEDNNEGQDLFNSSSPVIIEELPYSFNILEKDISGNRYMEAMYSNDSSFKIKDYTITVMLKDKNEKVYLSCYDEVLPGEMSPKFTSFAPDTGKTEDIEVLKVNFSIVQDTGAVVNIEYDSINDKYKMF